MGLLSHLLLLLLEVAACTITSTAAASEDLVLFDSCDVSVYYQTGLPSTAFVVPNTSDSRSTGEPAAVSAAFSSRNSDTITAPTRTALHALLARTHRRSLPYTDNDPNDDDVWKALLEIDGNLTQDSVHLIYKDTELFNAQAIKGTPAQGWNREHLWPQSRGVGDARMEAAFVDIHHLVPSDWNVNAARGNKYFGDCTTVIDNNDNSNLFCTQPAHPEASPTTEASSLTFLPPLAARGRIARAILYMDIRYEGTTITVSGVPGEDDGVDLVLTDCLSRPDTAQIAYMGSKAQLLRWHQQYPVTDQERRRNQRACERWQGNRNPFVDFPEWVQPIFGTPINVTSTDPCQDNDDTSQPPTPSTPTTTSNCPLPGSIMFVGVNTDNPDTVAMLALENITPGTLLLLTDNAWQDNAFRNNEGTLQYIVPNGGISQGSVFGPGVVDSEHSSWTRSSGSFSLSASGDTVLLYCLEENDTSSTTTSSSVRHITGLSLSGGWEEDETSSSSSALPSTIAGIADVTLVHSDNVMYKGPREGTRSFLREQIRMPDLWDSSNDERFSLRETDFDFNILTTDEQGDSSMSSRSSPAFWSTSKALATSSILLATCILL